MDSESPGVTVLGPAIVQPAVMFEFETHTCEHGGESFRAHPSANAAENGYCSPARESAGKSL